MTVSNEMRVLDVRVPLYHLCGSLLVSLGLVRGLSPRLSPLLYPTYNTLPRRRQLDWDTRDPDLVLVAFLRVASNVHALLVCTLLTVIFLTETDMYNNLAWGESLLARCTCGIVIGYLLSDVLVIVRHWAELGDWVYLLHHAATMLPYYFVLNYGVMIFFAMYRLWAEFSTPFINKRWILEQLNYSKSSRAYVMNGLVMSGSFFLCRIATIPGFYWFMYRLRADPDFHPASTDFYYWVALWSCVVLDVLNVAWMVKITRGAVKLLRAMARGMDDNDNDNLKTD